MMAASERSRIHPMIFCTISEPLVFSITSVSCMAGAPISTAVFALGYCAPSMMLAAATRSSRSGAADLPGQHHGPFPRLDTIEQSLPDGLMGGGRNVKAGIRNIFKGPAPEAPIPFVRTICNDRLRRRLQDGVHNNIRLAVDGTFSPRRRTDRTKVRPLATACPSPLAPVVLR